ncbi:hypothetical protein DYB28_002063 [Aphanomyces astaci]|uniref:SAM domain-containing protein n=1 Tax=Aphanomyces astaci TaxID=112090 RepID=A0A9X8EBU2_APHAT|nr:hypothetical protein DYB28_002063 [Aphanomyces astaci]
MDRRHTPLKHITRDQVPTVNLDQVRQSRSWEFVCTSLTNDGDLMALDMLDTIFISGGEITAWYFTTKDGFVARKMAKNVTAQNICQAFTRVGLAYEKNHAQHVAVLWRDQCADCELLSAAELLALLEKLPRGSMSLHAFVNPKGELHAGRFANFEHDFSINKHGKAQSKSFRIALGAQRITCMDTQLTKAMDLMTSTVIGRVEKSRKCKVVRCVVHYAVDDYGVLFLVQTHEFETTPLHVPKMKKEASSSTSLGPSATTQRMLARAKLEELMVPDERAVEAIMAQLQSSKHPKPNPRGLTSLVPPPPNALSSPAIANGGLSKLERRALSATYLGSSQKSGCCGDYCSTVIDPSGRMADAHRESLLGFPKGSSTLSSKALKYEQRLGSPVKSADDNNNPLSPKHDTTKVITKPTHRVPFKCIAQTRAEKDLVALFVRRYLSGESCDYLAQEYFGDGEALGESFPGYYYQDCDVCANCFAFYTLIDEARSKALKKLSVSKKGKRRHEPPFDSQKNVVDQFATKPLSEGPQLPWEVAWTRVQTVLRTITKVDVAELRSFVHPPPAVAMVTSVLMILLLGDTVIPPESSSGGGDDDAVMQKVWAKAKKELSQGDKIMTLLTQLDLNALTSSQIHRARLYMSNALYNSDVITPIWKCAAKFCDWTVAVVDAYTLLQGHEPPTKKFTAKIRSIANHPPVKTDPTTTTAMKSVVQAKQMTRLCGPTQATRDDSPLLQHTFRCKDGVTMIPYEVVGMVDVALTKANLVVCHDFFDTLDATKVFFRSVVKNHPGCQILFFNFPGQAGTQYPVERTVDRLNTTTTLPPQQQQTTTTVHVLNNLFASQCVYELLTHLHTSAAFLLSVPFHVVGFGNGGNIATCLAIQYGRLWPSLTSIVLVNAFAKIDAQLAGILHGALNLFSCLPPNRPDLPLTYLSKFLFSDAYVAKVDPNMALSIYTAVTNAISLEGRIRICKGALYHVDLVAQLREVAVPLVVVQSVENGMVAPTNVDPFLEGFIISVAFKGDLNAKARQLLSNTLNSKSEKSAFVAWLRAGHEVRQESKTYICDLLEFLVAWPTSAMNDSVGPKDSEDDPTQNEELAATAITTNQLSTPAIKPIDEPSNTADVAKVSAKDNVKVKLAASQPPRLTLFKQGGGGVKPPTVELVLEKKQPPDGYKVSYAPPTNTSYDADMERTRAKLSDQVAAAEALAMEKQLLDKQDVERRLSTLRHEQELRRKQWEDEDNERLRLLELEFLGQKAARTQDHQALEATLWQDEVQREQQKMLLAGDTQGKGWLDSIDSAENDASSSDLPRDTIEAVLAHSTVEDLVLDNVVGAPPAQPTITNLFEELEAEDERKRKVGVLKVEEYELVKKQMALAQAERDKVAKVQQMEAESKLRDSMAVIEVTRLRIEYDEATLIIQRCYKGSMARRAYRHTLRNKYAVFIQRVYRGYVGRKRVGDIRQSFARIQILHAKATKLQATYKMYREKDKYLGSRVRTLAANEIQRVVRGHLARTKVSKMKEWQGAAPGPEKLSLGLKRIEESKAEFERQQQEIDALHRAQEQAELKVSEIHSSLTESQKELAVLERELLEIDQIETDLHELTHEAEMLRTKGVDNTVPLGNGIVLNQPNETGGFETKEEARKRQAEAYAIEMAIHIKRAEREKKKKELEAEFTSVFNDVQAKKHALEEMEGKLSDMEAARMRKDREFTRLQRNLMELLEEQKYELDMIREKGIELETATATSAAAAAATAMKAKEHEKKSQAIFESTEELMKFQFMSMSLSYFSSLNMLKSLRDINADTTASAISSTAETAATAAAAAAAANIPTMKRLQVGSAELLDAASKKKKAELEEKKKREQEALEALKQPFPNAMRDWAIDDVCRWLDVLSLSQYKQAFKEGAVDGALLLELRPEDLSDILGVTHKAHILKLLVSRKKYLPLSSTERMKVSAVESEDASDNARKGVPDMETAFSQARNGRLKRLIESVEAGFDVNTEDDKGNTLLLTAAQNVNQKMVEYLILKGSNVNHKNAQGNTALHFAMAYDKEGVVGEYLIGHGADDTIENMFGLSPYDGISAEG